MTEMQERKGTTTIGIKCTDGVILAADTRATMGLLIANKQVDKVLEVTPYIGMTIAGGVGDAQTLNKILKVECNYYEIQRGTKIPVKSAASVLGNILQNRKYFPYWVQILLGGYDTEPRLCSLDLTGGILEEEYVCTGSGTDVAYGVFEDAYKKNKPVKENLPLAVRVIHAAIKRNAGSGDNINVAIIDKDGFRKLPLQEITKLL